MLILWITLKSWEYKKSLFAYISIEFPWPLKTLHSPLTNNCNKTKGEIKLWLFKIIVFACELESMAMVVTTVIKILFQQNYSYWKEFLNLGKFLLQRSRVRSSAAQNWSFTATTPTFEPLSSEGCHLYITLWHMWMHASTQRSPNVLLQASLELFSTFHLPHRVIQICPTNVHKIQDENCDLPKTLHMDRKVLVRYLDTIQGSILLLSPFQFWNAKMHPTRFLVKTEITSF